MTGYPVMLNLAGKSCVIVGGGKVATRKTESLLKAGAVVTVISPEVTPNISDLARQHRLYWLAQPYSFDILSQCSPVLVFAATDSEQLNQQIAADAHRIGAWVNVASDSGASDFHNMAVLEQAPLTIAISTNGTSPALLKYIKAHIEQMLGSEFSTFAQWLGKLRLESKTTLDKQSQRQDLYETIIQSDVLDLLQAGDIDAAKARFDGLVREVLA